MKAAITYADTAFFIIFFGLKQGLLELKHCISSSSLNLSLKKGFPVDKTKQFTRY
jgi:hypothetical protein